MKKKKLKEKQKEISGSPELERARGKTETVSPTPQRTRMFQTQKRTSVACVDSCSLETGRGAFWLEKLLEMGKKARAEERENG